MVSGSVRNWEFYEKVRTRETGPCVRVRVSVRVWGLKDGVGGSVGGDYEPNEGSGGLLMGWRIGKGWGSLKERGC